MNLTVRDQEHQRRGHWHFDPTKKTKDVFWSKRSLPTDVCQRAVEIILPIAEHAYYNLTDTLFVNVDPLYSKDGGPVKPTLSYNTDTQGEAVQDAADTLNDFVYGKAEPRRSWNQTVRTEKIPGLMPWFKQAMDEFEYLDNQELLDWRILIQWPGQVTYKHIDHVFVDYDKRTDRFEKPPTVGNKFYTLLTDSHPGDYLQWGNELITKWNAGDSFTWNWGLPHFAANFSEHPRVAMMANLSSAYIPKDFAQEGLL